MTRDPHTGLDVLSHDECFDLLTRAPLGRVGVQLEGHPPTILLINYLVHDGQIVFRTDTSSMLHRADHHTVAFEIDGIDRLYHLDWRVVVVGVVEEVTDPAELAHLATLPLGTWAPGPKSHWMRIRPDTVTGRSISPGHEV